jgi:hypothetical protein
MYGFVGTTGMETGFAFAALPMNLVALLYPVPSGIGSALAIAPVDKTSPAVRATAVPARRLEFIGVFDPETSHLSSRPRAMLTTTIIA